jgi:hypothetical protein
MSMIWTLIIGFVAGVIAKFLMPGKNEPVRSHNSPGHRRRIRGHLSRSGSGLVWPR